MMRIGLDVGSTTLKCVVLNEQNEVLFKKYERHLSRIVEKSVEMLREVAEQFPKEKVLLSISGSAGMGLAERSDIQFVQEVYATRIAVCRVRMRSSGLAARTRRFCSLRTAITPPALRCV